MRGKGLAIALLPNAVLFGALESKKGMKWTNSNFAAEVVLVFLQSFLLILCFVGMKRLLILSRLRADRLGDSGLLNS